jgi:hypothetical protein
MATTFSTTRLLSSLREQINALEVLVTNSLIPLSDEVLLRAPAAGQWSAIQCLEHLNGYSRLYLPKIENAIMHAPPGGAPEEFKSSWLGNRFTNMMQPKPDGKPGSKYQTPKAHRPEAILPVRDVIARFQLDQQKFLMLLEQAGHVNLQSIKIPSTLGSWLKFSLGDTFRYLIAHEERHVLQAMRAVNL